MAKWVYSFGDGHAEGSAAMRDLLGGKGANLAEMANLGLPVPPGFTITTEVCTYFYENGRTYPEELRAEVEAALAAVAKITGKRFGDAADPLLVSVRSGLARVDAGHDGHGPQPRSQRRDGEGPGRGGRPALRLRFLPPLHPDVWQRRARRRSPRARGNPRDRAREARLFPGHRDERRRLADRHRQVQGAVRGDAREPLPAGSLRPAVGRNRRRLRFVDERPRRGLPAAPRHPGRLGHRGQRPGDGLRQYGRHLGHRRRLHPQSLERRRASFTASSSSTPRARTSSPASARRRT